MMAGPGGESPAGGGPARHIPVLLDAVIAALEPAPGKVILDGTFGAGGYARALLESGADVVAIDRDPEAIAAGRRLAEQFPDRLRLTEGRFSQMEAIAGGAVDGVVLDVGVSSMQLDEAERGFSFRMEGPLDMRMGRQGPSAADVVNRLKAADLARIFGLLGEERHAGRVGRAVERRRAETPFETTRDLAEVVERTVGRKPADKIHPATRVFQALRIFVNDELGELARALFAAEHILKPGGVLAVVTFHSLEDRIVKRFLAARSGAQAGSRHLPEAAPP
ncbi:16S rRNA (cytosine(1402)-N(4))-methyltransferase RsmH, partial [Nitratireductor sp. GCM10026969]|uniref:16S rRNA (cytosine(1402)-N(4))-methyltransferase RsmH n=1 Tax=Nitratireductor sp. GCM10026969 TaxID=3252645 RepID=UPI00360A04B0